ncbi:transposable element Tcb1 transposase [Trichonephila clavipes]|nr:transposable element Tcb1 transposase [Trichonephila clavipes]
MAAVALWSRYRIVADFVTSSSPVPLKTRRLGSDARYIYRELKRPPVGVMWYPRWWKFLRSSKVHQEIVLAAELSIHGRAVTHKPSITPQNAKYRLQWCRAHRHWTVDMWKTVLWSDESRFTVSQSDGRVWQDNCSIHTTRLAQTWFDEMGVQKLDWPSQSPDLNPIEHLWDELERRLRSQPNRPSSLQLLTSAVMDAWKAIPMIPYQKLVENLPKRVQAVIHAKGGPTSY